MQQVKTDKSRFREPSNDTALNFEKELKVFDPTATVRRFSFGILKNILERELLCHAMFFYAKSLKRFAALCSEKAVAEKDSSSLREAINRFSRCTYAEQHSKPIKNPRAFLFFISLLDCYALHFRGQNIYIFLQTFGKDNLSSEFLMDDKSILAVDRALLPRKVLVGDHEWSLQLQSCSDNFSFSVERKLLSLISRQETVAAQIFIEGCEQKDTCRKMELKMLALFYDRWKKLLKVPRNIREYPVLDADGQEAVSLKFHFSSVKSSFVVNLLLGAAAFEGLKSFSGSLISQLLHLNYSLFEKNFSNFYLDEAHTSSKRQTPLLKIHEFYDLLNPKDKRLFIQNYFIAQKTQNLEALFFWKEFVNRKPAVMTYASFDLKDFSENLPKNYDWLNFKKHPIYMKEQHDALNVQTLLDVYTDIQKEKLLLNYRSQHILLNEMKVYQDQVIRKHIQELDTQIQDAVQWKSFPKAMFINKINQFSNEELLCVIQDRVDIYKNLRAFVSKARYTELVERKKHFELLLQDNPLTWVNVKLAKQRLLDLLQNMQEYIDE